MFYTPQYIVDYIVAQTLGPLTEGKTPAEMAGVTVCDPACGSGSFLLGAYQFLLDKHRAYYDRLKAENPKRGKKRKELDAALTPAGELTTKLKKEILLNSIFGTDIDANAVEVTKLSLMLKALEGETEASLDQTMSLFNERALPSLDANIQTGNALIDLDYFDELEFDAEDQRATRAFNWQSAFPAVFDSESAAYKAAGRENPGFDAVIGNPPYVRQELLTRYKSYFERAYRTFDGKADLYVFFIEKGLRLARPGGYFSIIVANKWMRATYGEKLRRWMAGRRVVEILDFGDLPVFEQATTYPCILTLRPGEPAPFRAARLKTLDFPDGLEAAARAESYELAPASLNPEGWNLLPPEAAALLDKLRATGVPLGEYANGKIYRGVLTGLNAAFVVDAATKDRLIAEDPNSAEVLKPFLAGRDIKRYAPPKTDKWLIFLPKGITMENHGSARGAWSWLEKTYPAIAKWLAPFEAKAKKRHDQGDFWWELRACDYYQEFEQEKIIIPAITKIPCCVLDRDSFYSNDKTTIVANNENYVLGLLNSSITQFFISETASTKRGGYFEWKPLYISNIPIPIIDPANKNEAELKAKIERAVDNLLQWKAQDESALLPNEKQDLAARIQYEERKIDDWVFDLYGLDDAERAIVRGMV